MKTHEVRTRTSACPSDLRHIDPIGSGKLLASMVKPLMPVTCPATRYGIALSIVEAPGKFAVVNSPSAGSVLTIPVVICGTSDEFFIQTSNCEYEPPKVKLCEPFSQVSVFRMNHKRELVRCSRAPTSTETPPCP